MHLGPLQHFRPCLERGEGLLHNTGSSSQQIYMLLLLNTAKEAKAQSQGSC